MKETRLPYNRKFKLKNPQMKILIVDDEMVNRNLLEILIQPYGKTGVAADGKEAYEAIVSAHNQNEPFDVVFLDIMMPEMDGHEVLKKVRKWEEKNLKYGYSDMKIVMVSALGMKEHILSSFKEGCEFYIIKPVSRERIDDVMAKMGYTKD